MKSSFRHSSLRNLYTSEAQKYISPLSLKNGSFPELRQRISVRSHTFSIRRISRLSSICLPLKLVTASRAVSSLAISFRCSSKFSFIIALSISISFLFSSIKYSFVPMGYFSFFGCKVFKIGHEKIGLTVTASPIFSL